MMGRQLFYASDVDDAVPEDHLVRRIATVLDLSWVHGTLAPHYSNTGRPSIDLIRFSVETGRRVGSAR